MIAPTTADVMLSTNTAAALMSLIMPRSLSNSSGSVSVSLSIAVLNSSAEITSPI